MKHLIVSLATLSLAVAPVCYAAAPPTGQLPEAAVPAVPAAPAATTAQPPPESLDELDEVVVRGKHLAQEIADAEDQYFALFNEVNKDDRYDTHCAYLALDSDSRIQSRVCMPGFVADAMAAWAPFRARCQPPQEGNDEFACLDRNRDGRLSRDEASAREELIANFELLDKSPPPDGFLRRDEFDATCSDCNPADLPSPSAVYMPPAPQLILMEGSKRWYDHMLTVTNSDPRLKKMADHLGGLYQELAATQRQYDKLETQARPKAAKPSQGPRKQ